MSPGLLDRVVPVLLFLAAATVLAGLVGAAGVFDAAAVRAGQLANDRLRRAALARGVDDGDALTLTQQRGKLTEQRVTDEHVVGVGAADVHPRLRHRGLPRALAISSTMSAGSRPSVSTWTVPSRS